MRQSVTVITDASFCSQTKAAGYGIWIAGDRGSRAFEGPLPKRPSDNNVAEAMAIANALYHGLKTGLIKQHSEVLIQTDSASSIELITGVNVTRVAQFNETIEVIHSYAKRYDLRLICKHVPGHTKGADRRTRAQIKCDTAAKRQMRKLREKLIQEAKHG